MRVYGHLGELIQGRMGPSGPVALITLPSPELFIQATRHSGVFSLHQPDGAALRREQACRIFHLMGTRPSGKWTFRANMPIGEGAGASTASIMAMAQMVAPEISMMDLSAKSVAVEGASDPLSFPAAHRILWASRMGRVLERMPAPAKVRIVGGFFGPKHRTDAKDSYFPDISDIVAQWSRLCTNPEALGRMVTMSSARTMTLRGGDFTMLDGLKTRFGALGVGIAHTGAAAAFLVPPSRDVTSMIAVLRGLGWRYVHDYTLG